MEASTQTDNNYEIIDNDEEQIGSISKYDDLIDQTPNFSEYDIAIKNSDLQKMNFLYEFSQDHDYYVIINLCIEHGNLEFFKIFFNPKKEYIPFIYSCVDFGRFDFVDFLKSILDLEIIIREDMTLIGEKK